MWPASQNINFTQLRTGFNKSTSQRIMHPLQCNPPLKTSNNQRKSGRKMGEHLHRLSTQSMRKQCFEKGGNLKIAGSFEVGWAVFVTVNSLPMQCFVLVDLLL